jgi:ribosomal protein S7
MTTDEERLFALLMEWFTEDVTSLNREYVAENLNQDIIAVIKELGWRPPPTPDQITALQFVDEFAQMSARHPCSERIATNLLAVVQLARGAS